MKSQQQYASNANSWNLNVAKLRVCVWLFAPICACKSGVVAWVTGPTMYLKGSMAQGLVKVPDSCMYTVLHGNCFWHVGAVTLSLLTRDIGRFVFEVIALLGYTLSR